VSIVASADIRSDHRAAAAAFQRGCRRLGLAGDPRLFWYHAIDLGDGLVTPGTFDYRPHLDAYGLPASMAGLRVLDVGSATGFFAFAMERRGAEVVSVELPDLLSWDLFPGESRQGIVAKIRRRLPYHMAPEEVASLADASPSILYELLIDGPFRFCHDRLRSRVAREYATIHGLPDLDICRRRFDLVMLGDILLHVIDPLSALAAAAAVCGGTLVVAQELSAGETPAAAWVAGSGAEDDAAEWWRPNLPWFRAVLTRLGFAAVTVAGHFTSQVRPGGEVFAKTVIHAHRISSPHRQTGDRPTGG